MRLDIGSSHVEMTSKAPVYVVDPDGFSYRQVAHDACELVMGDTRAPNKEWCRELTTWNGIKQLEERFNLKPGVGY